MSVVGFGIFNSFWDEGPKHMSLLRLLISNDIEIESSRDSSLECVYSILRNNPVESIIDGIKLLIENPDWRPDLVACIALLALTPTNRERVLDLYWKRLNIGSWVSPQLVVTLSTVDPDFISRIDSLYKEEFHSPNSEPRATALSNRKVQAAVEFILTNEVNHDRNFDSGASIASGWKTNLLKLIDEGKVVLGEF